MKMESDNNKRPLFCVVQFSELPFEGIDDYVCVPNSWVVIRRRTDQKVAVTYPKYENPLTRDRVKKQERYSNKWEAYLAVVKYESNSFQDADFWIATRTNYDNLVADASKRKDTQPKSKLDRKLCSTQQNCPSTSKEDKFELTAKFCDKPVTVTKMATKRPAPPESNKQPVKTRYNPDKNTDSIHAIDNHVDIESRHSEKEPIMARVNEIMESAQSKKSAAASGTEQKSQPQSSKQNDRQNSEQVKSMPIIAVDNSTEVITIDGDGRSRSEEHPSGTNINRQNQVPRDTSAASTTAPKPSISAGQDVQPCERNNQNQSLANENSSSNIQPKIADVRSIATVNNGEISRIDDASNKGQSTSHRVINSLKMSAELYNHMNGAPFLIPNEPPIEKKMHFKKIESNMATDLQEPSNLMYQTQDIPRASEIQTRNGNDLKAPPRRMSINSQEINCRPRMYVGIYQNESAIDPKVVLDSMANVASALHNCSSLPQPRPNFVRILNEQQNSSAQEGSQQTACVRDVPRRLSKSQNIVRDCSIEEFLSNGATSVQRQPNPATNQIYQNVPRSLFNQYQPSNNDNSHLERQREASRRSIENNYSDHQPYTVKITSPSVGHPPTNASNSSYRTLEFPQQRLVQPNHQDSQQQSAVATPKIPVGTSIIPKNKRDSLALKRVSKKTSSSVTSKVSTSIKHALSTTSYQLDDQQSRANLSESAHENVYRNPNMEKQCVDKSTATNSSIRQVHFQEDIVRSPTAEGSSRVVNMDTSDSEDDLNGDFEMSSDETANDVDCTGSPTRNDSSDQPVSVQNSTSTNQDNCRFAVEQQMLNHFHTLFSQMGSTLYQTAEMFKTLRSSTLESAQIYKKLLASVESFNNLQVPPVSEERQTGVTEREHSGNGGSDQQNFNSVNEPPSRRHNNLWRFVLPPEYDADDTRWTLKWVEHVPGLVELSPRSGIYVSYAQLQYIQQVSKDCRTLARGLLPEIFSKRALSVCSSITEKAQSSENDYVRPELDKRACSVLLKHVLEYGLQRGWNVDIVPILIAVHNKIKEIRLKYGIIVRV